MITIGIHRVDRWYTAVTRGLEFASDALAGVSCFLIFEASLTSDLTQIICAVLSLIALCLALFAEVVRLYLELRWTRKLLRVTGAVRTFIQGVDGE